MSFLQLSTTLAESWEILVTCGNYFHYFLVPTQILILLKVLPFIWQKRTVFSSWLIHKRPNWKIFTLASFWEADTLKRSVPFQSCQRFDRMQYCNCFSATRWHFFSLQLGQEYKPWRVYHTYLDQLLNNTEYCIFPNAFTKIAAEILILHTHTHTRMVTIWRDGYIN